MKNALLLLLALSFFACNNNPDAKKVQEPEETLSQDSNADLAEFFETYWNERMPFYPLEATATGDSTYNDRLTIAFTDSFRDSLKNFYTDYLIGIQKFNRPDLSDNDRISYDIFKREMEMQLEALKLHDNYMPFNQFWGLPLDLGQLGSGAGNQPFKTASDYLAWISRAGRFAPWADSAIVYFRKGLQTGV
ncbi:MAG TPA: DUF885 family protein, partial [Flavisolibacter sp.]|nr:DUF885 family protein [Flavisolibacter sp.]